MMAAQPVSGSISLSALLGEHADSELPEINIESLSQSAEEAAPGGLYLALAGSRFHGLDFLDEAVARGAVAVAWEPTPGRSAPAWPAGVVGIAVPGLRQLAGSIADHFYGAPSASMKVAGVTGTNGKTSVTFLVAQALEHLSERCGVMGTLGSGRPGSLQASSLTTPDAVTLHRKLAGLLAQDVRHVAIEVSSHALVQGRINAVRFSCAAFTNLSRDHLDYHGDIENYGEAKSTLFTRHLRGTAVINAADPYGRRIVGRLPAGTRRILVNADEPETGQGEFLQASDLEARPAGLSFLVSGSFGEARLDSRLVGDFNASNLLLSLAILLSWGRGFHESLDALAKVKAPAGRMETFAGDRGPLVIVDYAHTPDALEKVLRAARAHASRKLIVVFGCGGERDRGKRPLMGSIAMALADRVVVTDDNPRAEDPDAIVAEILAGVSGEADVERDRAAAIAMAIAEAGSGDVVVIAGKGHETYQTTGQGRQPFSDREVVAGLLRAAGGRGVQ